MWALVKNDVVDTIYYNTKSIMIGNVRYPANMFTLYTTDEKKHIGIYDIVRKSKPDTNFYNVGTSTYKYNSNTDTVNEDFDITEKDLEGLKSTASNDARFKAYTSIQPFNWLVQRNVFDSTQEIPSNVINYTHNVRTFCRDTINAIEECDTLSEFKTVFKDITHPDGQYHTLPDKSVIKEYERY